MSKRIVSELLPPILLLIVPALGLGALGLLVVAAAGSGSGTAGMGGSSHFAARQAVGLACGAALGGLVARLGGQRMLRLAPVLYAAALAITLLVFVPGIGVRAAGASRWLRLGPFSGSPAPFLIAAIGLLMAAWSRRLKETRLANRSSALVLALAGVLVLAAEPDFSAAAIALLVALAALAGGGAASRRLLPVAVILLVGLVLGASQFGYVGGRIDGFLSPESDRRGKGFEVLALARTNANSTPRASVSGMASRAAGSHRRGATTSMPWSARSWGGEGRWGYSPPGSRSRRVWRGQRGRRASIRDAAPPRSGAGRRCSRRPRCTSRCARAGCRSSGSQCRF